MTVGMQDGVLRVTGERSEVNRVSIERYDQNDRVRFVQEFDAKAGPGCDYTPELVCNTGSAIVVNLGGGNDDLGLGANLPAPVRYSGGTGGDAVTWYGGSVSADNDGRPDDGPAGVDDIEADVEVIVGSNAADRLGSGSTGAGFNGRDGDDDIRGGSGPDRITAAYIATDGTEAGFLFVEGSDTISCGGGRDFVVHDLTDTVAGDCEAWGRPAGDHYRFQGSSGSDFIGQPDGWEPARTYAGSGNDVVQGQSYGFRLTRVELGSGDDRFRGGGPDKVFGQSGRDSIDVRDRRTDDEVYCGSGRDSVRADRGDKISSTCEIVRRLPVR
jgi:hypothetical protein